ncbi:ABC transporter ATP-binding protein [Thermodesulfobacteriota bacterium]
MIDRVLGKDIGKYVKKHRLLMVGTIIPAIFTALLAVIPVIITESFIDDGMMKIGNELPVMESTEVALKTDTDSGVMEKSVEPSESKPMEEAKELFGEPGSLIIDTLTKYNIIEDPSPNTIMITLAIIFALSVFLKSITTYICEMAAAAFSNRAIKSLRIDLHEKFMSLDQKFYHKNKAGSLISRSTVDLTVMQSSISNICIGLVLNPLLILFFSIFLFNKDYILTFIVFVTVPVIWGLIRLFGNKVKKHSIRMQDATADVTSVYQETLFCLKIIQGFCTSENHSQYFQKAANFLYKKTMHWNRWLRGMGPMMDSTASIILPAILIFGIIFFKHTPGGLVAMFYAFTRVYSPIKSLGRINNDLRTLQGATERVFSIMNTKSEIEEKEAAAFMPRHKGSIEFKNICFYFKEEIPILQDITLSVNSGEMVAFVGSTGAGKSTLLDLIPRFYDVTGGQILIDGYDIRNVTIDSLRKQIGLVTQEVLLFHDTILNNITCASSDFDMQAVIKAATASHAHDFIMEQPNQYETVVGDRGMLLSGGQKQRISIARAILTNPSILILDEVASALDAESEELIQKSIAALKGKCTIFAVAHRLSTIRNADRIFVLEKGKIVESGTQKELMVKEGRFKQLYDMQFNT